MYLNLYSRSLFVLLAICIPAVAQVCDSRSGSPIQMQVQLDFSDAESENGSNSAAVHNETVRPGDAPGAQRSHDVPSHMEIQVQLQDPTGGTLQEASPGEDGQVRFTACRKTIYRLRVIGPDIEEVVLDNLHPGQADSHLTVVLRRKGSKRFKAQKATVSARRLGVPKKAQKEVDNGDAALKQGDLESARKHYLKATGIYPAFEEAENKLGVVLMREGRGVEGKAAFDRAFTANSGYAPVQLNLAKIALDEKHFAESYALVREALRTEPLNPDALFVAVESSFFSRKFPEAVNFTRTLHSLPHRQYSVAHFLAGKSLEAQNQPQAALIEYQMFLEEDPTDPNAKRARELVALLQRSGVESSDKKP